MLPVKPSNPQIPSACANLTFGFAKLCGNRGFSPLWECWSQKLSSQLLLTLTSFQQPVPWQMKCQNISKWKPHCARNPTPTAGWTFPARTQHTLEETKNSQMAINRSSKEGRWGRPQQGQFPGWLPNGALSQQCSGQEKVFIKTPWRRQNEEEKKLRLERFEIIAETERTTSFPKGIMATVCANVCWVHIRGHPLSSPNSWNYLDLARTLGDKYGSYHCSALTDNVTKARGSRQFAQDPIGATGDNPRWANDKGSSWVQ